jgi:broad specificity phosphatase PhoE
MNHTRGELSDAPLSWNGISESRMFAERFLMKWGSEVVANSPQAHLIVFYSGLQRTETLANALVETFGFEKALVDTRLRERNYGQWQGKSWDDAYNSDPEHFHDLVDRPDTYRPPDGETTTEMQQRIVSWYEEISTRFTGAEIVAVSHSGPIAALAGHILHLAANQWSPWIIGNLESIEIKGSVVLRWNEDRKGVERAVADC